MFAIAWQYMTGRAVATDPADRAVPEWPPHPDRVVQALVAAWGESGSAADEAAALRWLVAQPAPELACPLDVRHGPGKRVFVPVNDTEGATRGAYGDRSIGLLPDQRTRQPRQFPSVLVGDAVCALIWPDATNRDNAVALGRLCQKVTHVGHSSSLVRMWCAEEPPEASCRPTVLQGQYSLRVSAEGRIDSLIRAFDDGGAAWQRPPSARWVNYSSANAAMGRYGGDWLPQLVVLRRLSGAQYSLAQAPALVAALRGLLIATADDLPFAKRMISGHETDGSPLAEPHVAVLPLAFVGEVRRQGGMRFADGHVLGLGLALPRSLDADGTQEILHATSRAFGAASARERHLTLGELGKMAIGIDASDAPPLALRPPSWTGPARFWGTVTPIALDRSPPRRHADHDQWSVDQITEACLRQGLPGPAKCRISHVSPWIGAPASGAFPTLVRKDGTRRWHIHATLGFDEQVEGPLVLGAGRYRGYGIFKPMDDQR